MLTSYVAPILGSVAILPVCPYTGSKGVLKGDVNAVVIVAKVKRSTDSINAIGYSLVISLSYIVHIINCCILC
jgi:hypothetical protein